MRKAIYVALGISLGFAATLVGQALIPNPVIRGVSCRVDYYINNKPWEEVVAGGNPNVLYLLKTTEQLTNGQFQTGVATCFDNSQYSWQFTYR